MNPDNEGLLTVSVAANRRGCKPQNIYGMFARGVLTDHREEQIALGGDGSLRVDWHELELVPRRPGRRPKAGSESNSKSGSRRDRSVGGPHDGRDSIQELRVQIEEQLTAAHRERDLASAELIAAADRYRALAVRMADAEHARAVAEIERDSTVRALDAERSVRETYAAVLAQEFGPSHSP